LENNPKIVRGSGGKAKRKKLGTKKPKVAKKRTTKAEKHTEKSHTGEAKVGLCQGSGGSGGGGGIPHQGKNKGKNPRIIINEKESFRHKNILANQSS